jgi:hypothetical protein
MRRIGPAILGIIFLTATAVSAEEIETLEQAKAISAKTGKPILLKFFKED